MSTKITVIVITYNEEYNIRQCLESVKGFTDDIIVIDSKSTDSTVEIAKDYTKNIYIIEQGHWAEIRNWAMRNADIKYEWVLFLDADEVLTSDLKLEISQLIESDPADNGFYIKRRFIFLNKWLKHGGLYPEVLRLFRYKYTTYIMAGDVEYALVEGKTGKLKSDIIHNDLKPISYWIEKHNRISARAVDQYFLEKEMGFRPNENLPAEFELEGGAYKHWIKKNLWDKIPLIARPFIIFGYAYFFKLGILDGVEGFYYHSLQAFWYRILISVKIKEKIIQIKNKRIF
jgi:glycosyltransferase involved in cell wall biosynthesis